MLQWQGWAQMDTPPWGRTPTKGLPETKAEGILLARTLSQRAQGTLGLAAFVLPMVEARLPPAQAFSHRSQH